MPNCCINEFFKQCTDGVGARLALMYDQCLSIKKDGELGCTQDGRLADLQRRRRNHPECLQSDELEIDVPPTLTVLFN